MENVEILYYVFSQNEIEFEFGKHIYITYHSFHLDLARFHPKAI